MNRSEAIQLSIVYTAILTVLVGLGIMLSQYPTLTPNQQLQSLLMAYK